MTTTIYLLTVYLVTYGAYVNGLNAINHLSQSSKQLNLVGRSVHFSLNPAASAFISRSNFSPSVHSSRLSSKSTDYDEPVNENKLSPRRISYAILWVGLLAYANYFTASISPADQALSSTVLNTAIFTPFDGSLSPVFITLFFSLGVLPAIYASLILPTSKRQQIWALPFIGSSFALGFFGIGNKKYDRHQRFPLLLFTLYCD